jgi:hypothetical protein
MRLISFLEVKSGAFWTWFDKNAPRLGVREATFRKTFRYLDRFKRPLTIVETGCVRKAGNWAGDGQSTVLFDRYVRAGHRQSVVHSVDLDPAATRTCRRLVSRRVIVHTGDSVALLPRIGARLRAEARAVDLLYLDSFDLDWQNPTPSAVHALKELAAIIGMLRAESLVVVDDSAMRAFGIPRKGGRLQPVGVQPKVSGKGTYVAEYAAQVRARPLFSSYQAGWTGLVQ